ncbi:MAG TPA: hypothetical protein VES97_06755, partial [Solirubrobacteraceae bacterium]|nr:hypothetical protein [Solirubrobacteraceae bacterium]
MEGLHLRPRASKAWIGCVALACTVLAWCLTAIPAAWAKQPAASAGTRYARVRRVCPPPAPGSATCFVLVRSPVSSTEAGRAGVRPFTANDGAAKSGPAGGLTPAQLASAYG